MVAIFIGGETVRMFCLIEKATAITACRFIVAILDFQLEDLSMDEA